MKRQSDQSGRAKRFQKEAQRLKGGGKLRSTKTNKFQSQGVWNTGSLVNKRPSNYVNLGAGFPKMVKQMHNYVESFYLQSATGANNYYAFSCNGMYDPNITGTGHQPYYFDQMTALYDHYCVIGSQIEVTYVLADDNQASIHVSLSVDDNNTQTSANPLVIAEMPDSVYDMVGTQTGEQRKLVMNWSAKKYFGKNPLANTELQGTSAANPAEQSYFYINIKTADAAATSALYFTVKISYIAIWKELKEVAAS